MKEKQDKIKAKKAMKEKTKKQENKHHNSMMEDTRDSVNRS